MIRSLVLIAAFLVLHPCHIRADVKGSTDVLSPVAVNEKRPFSLMDVFQMNMVAEVSLSPDRKHIAYTLSVPRPFDQSPGGDYRELYLYSFSDKESKLLIGTPRSIFSLGWTPDSRSITYRSREKDSPYVQLMAFDIRTMKSASLLTHTNHIQKYSFYGRDAMVFTSEESVSEKQTNFRSNGFDAEIYEEEFNHINLYIHNFKNGETRQLTSGQTVFDFDVSHKAGKIAAAIAPKNLIDYDYMFRRIHLIDVATGEISLLTDNPGKLTTLSWSPDGKHLAFIASGTVHDAVSGSIYVVDIANPKPFTELRNYMHNMRASAIDVGWTNNSTIYFAAEEGVDIVLSEQKLGAAERSILLKGGELVFRRVSHHKGHFVMAGNTAEHPSELFSFRKNDLERLSNHNPWLDEVKLARQEKIVYHARDGLDIEGVLYFPLNFTEGKTFPLIVYIHGGPEAANQNGWNTHYSRWGQVAAARDYFVFMPNYRAGSGRGVAFTMEGFGDLLGKEYDDVLDGIDFLINKGWVDASKVGIGGGSYGGYFAAWSATKHSHRFAASVMFVGISNQVSKRNTTDIPQEDFLVHWGFWSKDDHERVWNVSPVKHAENCKTPILILHGKEDPRIPPSQGLELYRAIKLHGEAPVRLVYYPGEGHGNRKNTSRIDFLIRTMEWFDHYLKSDQFPEEMPDMYPEELLNIR